MTDETRRTLAVMALTAAAIGVPAAAWWVAGQGDAHARAARIRASATEAASAEAADVAARAGAAFARLAERETRRPWRHYHDAAALTSAPWTPDALVQAHFEVDGNGKVRLPLLGDDSVALVTPAQRRQCALRDELNLAVPAIWRSLTPECVAGAPQGLASDEDTNIVCVGPLQWRTLRLGAVPALLALRHVDTPDGPLTQGFVVDPAAARLLAGAGRRALLRAGPARPGSEAALPLAGAEWHVSVDMRPHLEAAALHEDDLRAGFAHGYALGLGFAAAAGLAAVALAWQAFRLARRRAEFAAVAAHELRTPLAGMRLHAGMLARGLGDRTRTSVYAQRVHDEAARLARVVDNLLASSARGRDNSPARIAPGDLAGTTVSCIAMLEPALEARGALVELTCEERLPQVAFDPEILVRIVHDLLDNAEKYSRGCEDRRIRVELQSCEGGEAVALSVEDAGPGIPDRERRRLFRPFARGRQRDAPAGLGLGLALALSRAHALRGDLACETSSRGGARFVLTLPICEGARGAIIARPLPMRGR